MSKITKKNIMINILIVIIGLFLSINITSCGSEEVNLIKQEVETSDEDALIHTVQEIDITQQEYDEKSDDFAENFSYNVGLFSWIPNTIEKEQSLFMFEIIEKLEINEVYQYFDQISVKDENAYNFANNLKDLDIDLYILAGDSDWTYKPDGSKMLNEIDRAVEFRKYWGKDTLKGIVFDIEPYISKKWGKDNQQLLMDNYVAGMRVAYEKAEEEGIYIIICIPTWYDTEYANTFEDLFNYCDEVSLMNYDRLNEYENIRYEIEYAKNLEKGVTCIFEFQAAGQYGLTEDNTYHNVGVDIARANFEYIYGRSEYLGLKFAYHYLESLKELLLDEY